MSRSADRAPVAAALHDAVIGWYDAHARDLPWRDPDASPWAVLVSEVMLQQTPVARVLPVWTAWMRRWPTPPDLAAAAPGEAVRAWDRLGYPRRALRLHTTAAALVARHRGEVPSTYDELRALPGIGDYTAAAVASFAFGAAHPVLDTNVRRVLARLVGGEERPAPATTAAERARALALLPEPARAPRWAVATMELGALVCTARAPRCEQCPVASACAWARAGRPAYDGPRRASQAWHGTDRQARGALLAVLRESARPVTRAALEAAWPHPAQRDRALHGLIADGLVEPLTGDRFALPA